MIRILAFAFIGLLMNSAQAQRDDRARGVLRSLPVPQYQGSSSASGGVSDEESCKSGKAANLALASLYGSCQAPMTAKGPAPGGGKDACGSDLPQSGEIKSTFQSGCGSGGMPEYSQEGARMQLKGDVVSFPNKKTDCSGIASGIQCRAGNNFKPGQDDCKPATTAEMINWGKGGDCYERVTDGKLKAGDMIVTRKGSGGKGGSGHVVTIADDKNGGGGSPDDYMIVEASSKSTGIVKRSPAAAGQATAQAFKSALSGGDGGGSWAVLRHKGDKMPGCKSNKKRTFEGEQCVQSCPNISPQIKI